MHMIAVECTRCKNTFVQPETIDHEAYDSFVCKQCEKGYYWDHFSFGSGTQIVQFMGDSDLPHYYVYANHEAYTNDHQRSLVCRELVAYLNRHQRPVWLESLVRDLEYPSQCKGTTPNGLTVEIIATGPDRGHKADPTSGDMAMRIALITKLLEKAPWKS